MTKINSCGIVEREKGGRRKEWRREKERGT
jgi:hypothetical protein